MKVPDSAFKHGVRPEDAIQAATWALWIEDIDDDSPLGSCVWGRDSQGRILRPVVLGFNRGAEQFFHVTKAQPRILGLLAWSLSEEQLSSPIRRDPTQFASRLLGSRRGAQPESHAQT